MKKVAFEQSQWCSPTGLKEAGSTFTVNLDMKKVRSTLTFVASSSHVPSHQKKPIELQNSRTTRCAQASSSRTEECHLLGCIVRCTSDQHELGKHKFVVVHAKDDFVYLRGLSKVELIQTSADNISSIIPVSNANVCHLPLTYFDQAIGGRIKIVRGEQKGATGTLVDIDQEGKSVHVRLDDGSLDILRLPFSGVSKYDADYISKI